MKQFNGLLPYAASGAALILLYTEVKEVSVFKLFKSKPYHLPLKLALGAVGCCGFFKLCSACKILIIRKLLNYRGWLYSPRSWTTKLWGIALKSLIPKEASLYSLQKYLPTYPLPSLEDTCKKTVEVFKPLLTADKFEEFQKLVEKLQYDEGPPLQKFLEARYGSEANWLADLWDNYAYLAGRSSIAVFSNFSCLGDGNDDYLPSNVTQNSFAANIIHFAIQYLEDMKNGDVTHMKIQDVVPICCYRYRYMMSTTRIPGVEIDQLRCYDDSDHVVIFKKGQMFAIDVYVTESDGKRRILTPREIQHQLDDLCKSLDASSTNPSVFTTLKRPLWAQVNHNVFLLIFVDLKDYS